MFKEFSSEVKKQIGKSIMILRFERDGEYLRKDFQDYLKDNVILS